MLIGGRRARELRSKCRLSAAVGGRMPAGARVAHRARKQRHACGEGALRERRIGPQWALGFLSQNADTGDVFFKKALAIDPAFARANFLLARNADLRGDWVAQRQQKRHPSPRRAIPVAPSLLSVPA